MCGRFTLFAPEKELAERFGVSAPGRSLVPRYNIAPSQPVAAVRAAPEGSGRELVLLRWGLIPSWAKDPSIGNRMINARSETAAEKPAFRSAIRRRRCLVPASGFYEWKRTGSGKRPYFARVRGGAPFGMAGLWERWEAADGSAVESCTILTTDANGLLAPVHDRMPAIVPPGEYDRWLDPAVTDPGQVAPILAPFPEGQMEAWPVSTRVNRPTEDDPRLIDPLP